MVNGHAGGRSVHQLSPAIKRTLPKLGDTHPEMKRTLSQNLAYREEIESAWRTRLLDAGSSALITDMRQALAADIIGTAELREAASRVIRQLSTRSLHHV